MKRKRFAVISVLLLCAMAMQAHAATITVTNYNDSGPGSLRQALANANNGDTINFALSGAIILTSGEILVNKNVTISGPGANQLSIHSHPLLFEPPDVFHVVSGKTVTISGLTIIGDGGPGILNDVAILTVSNCVVSGSGYVGLFNNASLNSNVIASLTIINSIFSNNTYCILNLSEPPHEISTGFSTNARFGATRTMAGGSTSMRKPANDGNGAGNSTARMTIINSVVTSSGPGVYNQALPPSVATVTMLNSKLTDSLNGIGTYATDGGNAEITLKNSTISRNTRYLGGIDSYGSSMSIVNSTISDNSFGVSGGGIPFGSYGGGGINCRGLRGLGHVISIVNSTISGNSVSGVHGGGIYSQDLDNLSIVNSTISGNSAGTGGGIYNYNSSLHVVNSTITGNSAGSGGGIYNDQSEFEISNTILDAGASGENIFNSGGTVTSHGYNLSSDDGGGYLNGPADQINTDPLLGPLQDNGGPTLTHALLAGSPAIDKGNSNGVHIDQRHFGRPFDVPGIPNAVGGDGSDVGAFEFGSFPLRGDFNGDGFTDYLLFNVGNRATAIWYLRDNTYISSGYGPSLLTGWTVADVADFNGDGNPDYALFNASTRQTEIWYLNNNVFVSAAYGRTLPSGWQLVAVGDFNSDGKPDYVLYNSGTRRTAIWYLTNNIYVSAAYGPTIAGGWQLVAVGDFNGDRKPDYVLYNASTRQTAIWYLNNNVYVSAAYGPTIASGYVLSGVADFNGDSKPDYVLYNAGTRQTAIWYLSNNIYLRSAFGPTLPVGWTLVAP
jgi:FG-GAP-like repeat/Right handed beta helix region